MKLWKGRFLKEATSSSDEFNASIGFDQRMYEEDITGSIAHAKMLGKQGIISSEESALIVKTLREILKDIETGKIDFTIEAEDIHMNIETILTDRIGQTGKKLHTARSRNDQVALDMKLYTRDVLEETMELLTGLLEVIHRIGEENIHTWMPGFTHLQKAQPTTLAHHMGAYFQMFARDLHRLEDCKARLNECPLGAGAFAGTTYPLDREYSAKLLGFDKATENSMDSVSDRDYLLETLSDFSILAMHLSRLSEEIIIWNTDEYRFVEMDDTYSTGSSIMPQKKNPDMAELIRGKCGRVYGAMMALFTTMKGLPLAYNKDMQEDKELSFDAMDTVKDCIRIMTGMLSSLHFVKDRMEKSARGGYTNATDAADYLVNKGIAFRDAHSIVGRLVLLAIDQGKNLEELSLEAFQGESPAFGEDIYEALSLKSCVERRNTKGAPGEAVMAEELAHEKEVLKHGIKKK